MGNIKIEKKNIVTIGFIAGSISFFLFFLYINIVQYQWGLNADVASDGILARLIWDTKEWIPDEWYVANETRIIGIANIAAGFYGITNSICLSMGMACVCGTIFIVAGLCFLGKVLEFEKKERWLLLLLVFLLPNNKDQLELLYLFASYYSIHVGAYFLTAACYIKIIKEGKIRSYLLVFISFLHFLLGAQGVRGILMITGPLMVLEVIRRCYIVYSKKKGRKEDRLATAFLLMLNVLAYIGGMIPISTEIPLSRNIRNAPRKLMQVVFPDFLGTFDWDNLMEIEKLSFTLLLVIVIGAVIKIAGKILRKKEVKNEEWIFLSLFLSVAMTILALTFTTVESSRRYFILLFFAMAFAVTLLGKKESKVIKYGLVAICTVIFIGNFHRIYQPMLVDRSYHDNTYREIGDYLKKEGYENAYTNFDHANIMTVANDGSVQVSAVDSFSTMEVCKWMTSKKWYVPYVPMESKTAYIVSDFRLEEFDSFLQEHRDSIEFKTKIGIFHIYGSEYNFSKLVD